MQRWAVRDRDAREIYMTEERWKHITTRHGELDGHLDNVLDTLRWGKRRQDKRRSPNVHILPSLREFERAL